MSFHDRCSNAMKMADADPNYIGTVCRFNANDKLIVTTRNDEYGQPPSKPETSSDELQLIQSARMRLKPLRQRINSYLRPAYLPSADRDVNHWKTVKDFIESGVSDYSMEAQSLYRIKYVKVGLVGPEWLEAAETQVRKEAIERVEAELWAARAKSASCPEWERLRCERELQSAVADTYDEIHGSSSIYPSQYVQTEDNGGLPGGHAEENLIGIWPAAVRDLKLEMVELFVTRMPCPDKSSGFLMSNTAFKEGCINKLIQLVAATPDVSFHITYYQIISQDLQAMSKKWADRGFPSNRVKFERIEAPQ